MSRFTRWLLAACVLAGLAAPANAQMRMQRPGGMEGGFPATVTGTVDAISIGMIRVSQGPDQPAWTLRVAPEAKFKITGKGNADSLGMGQCVSFSAEVDKKSGTTTDKVSKITVFSMTPQNMAKIGVFPGGLGGGNAGINPQGGADFGPPSKKKDAGPPTERFEIGGKIAGIKKGKISVALPMNQHLKGSVMVDLAEDVEVTFDLEGNSSLLGMVTKGSKIEAGGQQMSQNPPIAVVKGEVKIELAEASAEEENTAAKKPARGKPTRTTTRTKKGDQPEAGADDEKPEPKHSTRTSTRRTKKGDQPEGGDEKPEGGNAKAGDKADSPAEGKDKP
jgi:hypothetical protein